MNDGTGGFPGGSAANSPWISVSAIKAGDFNNDSKADLVVMTLGSNFGVLLGDGNSGFSFTQARRSRVWQPV